MSAGAIHRALAAVLESLGQAVSWENVLFTPDPESSWLREKFAPTRKWQTTLGSNGYNRVSGVYMIDVFTPVGQGWKDAEDLAETVMAAFPRGAVLTDSGVQVRVERSYRTAARQEPKWFHVPVTVEFWADIQP